MKEIAMKIKDGLIIALISPMKTYLLSVLFLVFTSMTLSQIETNTNSVQFEINDLETPDPTGYELPARTKPSLTIPMKDRNPDTSFSAGDEEKEKLDMTKSDGLMENTYDKAPKAFTKDKEPTPEYDRDQNLGEVQTGSNFLNVMYRDHEYVDGDLIRVYVNGDIVQSSVFLGGSFSGFTLRLDPGKNTIEFEALNQGSSGPNTAELHVYDENGMIISAKEWNLLTGRRAIIVVNKAEE